jgi:hypothetical protein
VAEVFLEKTMTAFDNLLDINEVNYLPGQDLGENRDECNGT